MELPKVAGETGVAAIVRQCDDAGGEVEVVDVTNPLVALFNPSPRTLKIVEELRKQEPVDPDVVEQRRDH